MAPNDFALIAHLLDRRTYLHFNFLSVNAVLYVHPAAGDYSRGHWRAGLRGLADLLEPVRDASAVQVVDGQLDRHLVSRQDLDVMHTHLARNVGQDLVAVFQLHLEHGVRQGFREPYHSSITSCLVNGAPSN